MLSTSSKSPRRLAFTKGHGTENDFIILDDSYGLHDMQPELIAHLCDRRAGVGADGVLRVIRAGQIGFWDGDPQLWFMDYYNADGSPGEMCGNGSRCATSLAHWLDMAPARHALGTDAGPVRAEVFPEQGPGLCEVKVQLTAPRDLQLNQEIGRAHV